MQSTWICTRIYSHHCRALQKLSDAQDAFAKSEKIQLTTSDPTRR